MTAYKRVSTRYSEGITVTFKDGREFTATAAQIAHFTEKNVKDAILQKIADLTDIFIHKNRDGTWCIATGAAPEIWPEDEVETN